MNRVSNRKRLIIAGLAGLATMTAGQAATAQTLPTTMPMLTPATTRTAFDASTPKAAVQPLAVALYGGDAATLKQVLYAGTTDAERAMTTATIDMAVALATFRQEAIAQFGADEVNTAMGNPADMHTQALARIESAVETITADIGTATVGLPGEPPVVLKKVNENWTVLTGAVSPSDSAEAIAERVRGVESQTTVLQLMTEDVRASRHRTMREVLTLLHGQMMKAATEPRAKGGVESSPTTVPVE